MVKIFTMVKGEDDIVRDWVMYHGSIFGFQNLHIIDNLSKDNTYPILSELKGKYGIHVYRLPDYSKKGDYMTGLFRKHCRKEYGFPIDIDEFIVAYDKDTHTISCDREEIGKQLLLLPPAIVYKMNYINAKLTKPSSRAVVDLTRGSYWDYGANAKSFFHSSLFRGVIDHGNHYHKENYYVTPFCLVHYHTRNLDQLKKKVYNNLVGLGYNPFDLNALIEIRGRHGSNALGFHHVQKQIELLTGEFKMPLEGEEPNKDISLNPIIEKIAAIY